MWSGSLWLAEAGWSPVRRGMARQGPDDGTEPFGVPCRPHWMDEVCCGALRPGAFWSGRVCHGEAGHQLDPSTEGLRALSAGLIEPRHGTARSA